MSSITITMPEHVRVIIGKLADHGYDAYIVGGCVRDVLLGNSPSDWDITTSARPEEVKALFSRTIDTGLKHGTVTVMFGKEGCEVTTFRIDGDYDDYRRPTTVTYTDDLKEDLARRDFTINAMAYNEKKGLIDLFGGIADLDRKMIRCVGAAEDRFGEDALRMLRAIRFAGQLGFFIEPETEGAIRRQHQLIANVSAERIQMELLKLMISDHPDYFRLAWETGLTSVFLPEFDRMTETTQHNPHHCYTVGEHTLHALTFVPNNPILRLTMLLHDIGKPLTKTTDDEEIDHFRGHNEAGSELAASVFRRLKFDNQSIRMISTLIRYHDVRFHNPLTTGRKHVRRMISRVGEALFPYLLDVMEADVRAQSSYLQEEKLATLAETRQAYLEIISAGDCLTLKNLAINGNDLKKLGISEGKVIGAILNTLLTLVLEDPSMNDPDRLACIALRIYRELERDGRLG